MTDQGPHWHPGQKVPRTGPYKGLDDQHHKVWGPHTLEENDHFPNHPVDLVVFEWVSEPANVNDEPDAQDVARNMTEHDDKQHLDPDARPVWHRGDNVPRTGRYKGLDHQHTKVWGPQTLQANHKFPTHPVNIDVFEWVGEDASNVRGAPERKVARDDDYSNDPSGS